MSNSYLSGIKNILAVAGGKGGVGKSTITVNLARAFEWMGMAVGVLDADIQGPSLETMLPSKRKIAVFKDEIIPALSGTIETVSMSQISKDGAFYRAPIINATIKQFLHSVKWGKLDVLLIDFPPGTGDAHLTLCQECALSAALMVSTPQKIARLDVEKAADLFHRLEVPIIGIVENMSYYLSASEQLDLFGRGGARVLAEKLKAPFLGEIPLDPEISKAMDSGFSLFSMPKLGVSAALFAELAKQIKEELSSCLKIEKI